MATWVNKDTRVIVQGITGAHGQFHARACKAYGSQVVAGVTPGKGGTFMDDVSVFDTVSEATQSTGANASLIFVPAPFAADAILEAVAARLALVVCITEGIPTLDMVRVKRAMQNGQCNTRLIGPNCPGIITPDECKMGIMPGHICKRGPVGVISRSGTLTYEAIDQLTKLGLGQSTCIGIGGDPVPGTNFVDCLAAFQADKETKTIVMIGEIGGTAEEEAAHFIKANVTKPVVGYVAGVTAPPGKRMGHAGAIIAGGASGSSGTAKEKMAVMRECGIHVTESPAEIGNTVAKII